MEEVPGGQENAPARWPAVTAVVSALVATSAIGAGMTVLAGWQYVRGYYREFGIEPSALSFSPYEYALHARFALALVILGFVSLWLGASLATWTRTLPESHWLIKVAPTNLSREDLRPMRVAGWVFLVIFAGLGLADWFMGKVGVYLLNLVVGLGLWTTWVATWFLTRQRERLLFGAVSLVAVVALVIFFVPGEQGKNDARGQLHHLDRFPAVSIVTTQELGLPEHEVLGSFHKYGPFRLILYNGGKYYVVAEGEPDTTLGIPEASVTYVQYRSER